MSSAARFTEVAEIRCDPRRAWVYEHGWQSWSPAGRYPATGTGPRPRRPEWQTMAFRPGNPPPREGFQGEGLLAVDTGEGQVHVCCAPDPSAQVPSIRTEILGDRVVVRADGPVQVWTVEADLPAALETCGERLASWAAGRGGRPVRSLPPVWCSWYGYWGQVTEADVLANVEAIQRLDLPVATVQIDDGHQAEIGDWRERAPAFGTLDRLSDRIAAAGLQAGIWTAPFLVGARSTLARTHPQWLVDGAVACPQHWDQEVRVLDVTHPDAAADLFETFASLRAAGFTYYKIDFLYAGAMEGGRHADATGLDAYREGMRIVRDAIGPDATLLGCGAPLLPSVGLVDAMRVGPDIDPRFEPAAGDLSQPGQRSALAATSARAWMHGRLWVNDPDCLMARPGVERRETWIAHVTDYGGLAASGDPLDALDAAGLEATRRALRPSSPTAPRWLPGDGPDQGRIAAHGDAGAGGR